MDKYILYKTTNLINNKIYIGVHKTSKPFEFDGYLANGIWVNKPCTYEQGKTKMQQAVKKYGVKNFKRETLKVFDTPEAAYKEEAIFVDESFLARPDVYNMVLGGELQEYRSIVTYQYDLQGNYLATYDCIKSAASAVNCNPTSIRESIIYNIQIKNYYWTDYKVDKLQINQFNNNFKINKEVFIYDSYSKKFLAGFKSLSEASKYMSLATSTQVGRSAKLGYIINDKFICSFIKAESYDKANSIYIKTRSVYKYDSNGNFIKEYKTQLDAEKENPYSNITKFIKNKMVDCNGFMWSLDKLDQYNVPPKNKVKKIGQYDLKETLIKVYKSQTECAKIWGRGVVNCINGKYKTHKNYVFKVID